MNRIIASLIALSAIAFAASPLFVTRFAGFDPTQFPVPQDHPPVQPAGYAFAIWGLIYTWLIIGALFGLLRRTEAADWRAHRAPLLVSLAIGIFWLMLAEWSPLAATAAIWVMLIAALMALFATTTADRWLQQAPVAIYAGWLTAASSVSIGLLLAGYGLTGEVPAALIALVVALLLAGAVQWRLPRAPEYGLTVIWALAAVIVANSAPLVPAVVGLAGFGVLAIGGVLIRQRLTAR